MAARNTTTRDNHRATIARQLLPCGICGGEIDYSLPYLHPLSFVVDHIYPLAKGGIDELTNKQAAHRSCNRSKGDKLPDQASANRRVTFVTSRTW